MYYSKLSAVLDFENPALIIGGESRLSAKFRKFNAGANTASRLTLHPKMQIVLRTGAGIAYNKVKR